MWPNEQARKIIKQLLLCYNSQRLKQNTEILWNTFLRLSQKTSALLLHECFSLVITKIFLLITTKNFSWLPQKISGLTTRKFFGLSQTKIIIQRGEKIGNSYSLQKSTPKMSMEAN